MRKVYLLLAKLFPQRVWRYLRKELIFAGDNTEPEVYLGSITLLSLLVSLIVFLIPISFNLKINLIFLIILSIFSFILVEFFFYLLLFFKIEDRTERVEKFLPDTLQLISTNLKTGMNPFKALRLSARKEFGPLSEEINYATSKGYGTESFSKALLQIGKRIKSETLERALDLFTTAMRSGGRLSKLLEEMARDIEETRSLRKELITSTKTSVSFIMFSIIIGAPLLLTISIEFIDFMNNLRSSTGNIDSGFGIGLSLGEFTITSSFMIQLSIFMLVTTSILSGILLGVLTEGKVKYGFKYIPIIMIGSILFFFIFRYIFATVFLGIL